MQRKTVMYMSKAEQIIQKHTREDLWKRFDTLPEKIKDLILSEKILDEIDIIAKRNGIPPEKNTIARYVHLTLAGIIPITLLRETLEEEFGISTDQARQVAVEIRDKIFMQVRDELRKVHGLDK